MNRKLALAAISLSGVLLVIGAFEFVDSRINVSEPLGEAPQIQIHPAHFSESERWHFLDGNFKIVKDVRSLPDPIVQTLIEEGGTRSLMANPGEKFQSGDVITDSSLPRKRLIFAGVTDSKCFIHYAQNGRALTYVIKFFRISPGKKIEPLWTGRCVAPAADMKALRLCINTNF
jgi:hypothetical protein